MTGYDVPADVTLQYISAARAANSTIRSSQYDGSLLSYFGRANYNFRDRYLVTGTLRFDQTSRFLGSNRTGVFPSVGAAFAGVVGSDRWSAYSRFTAERRALCHAHLKRAFQGLVDRGGETEPAES